MIAAGTRGLVKRFGDVTALDGVDLEVREGEIFGLLGPNGAGKTTTMRILVTLVRPDAGEAEIAGIDVLRNPERVRAVIGYVPQEVTADRYLTAREQLTFFADLYHLPAARRRDRVAELLSLVGLEQAADKTSRGYSGGMKKKLDLACGLIHEPRVLVLDEPSLGLDVQVRRVIWNHVLDLKRRGVTVILGTNYMDEADMLCDRVAIVDRGRIVAVDSPAALRAGLGGDVVTIEPMDGQEPGAEGSAAVERLKTVMTQMDFVRGAVGEGGRLHIYVRANETALPAVLAAASGAGISIRSAAYSRPGLEEVFLKYTGRAFEPAGPVPVTGAGEPAR